MWWIILVIFSKLLKVCLDITYFAETENWKHSNEIIFKCVYSVVGPIFNEKVIVKFVRPWTVHGYTIHERKVKTCWKKREGKHANEQNVNVLCIQTAPNSHIMKYIGNGKYFYIKYFVIKEHGILLGNCQTSRVKNWTIKEVQICFFCFFPKILRRCLKLLFKQ